MKPRTLVSAILLAFFSVSCARLNVPSSYIMTESSLRDTLITNEKNLILFWTDWCGAAHHRIENLYFPLNKKIQEQNLDLKIILLASDANISIEDIEKLRDKGIACYYIDKPGNFAIANRAAIKNFINNAFPENEIERIKGLLFGVPVELLITKDLEIINEKKTNESYDFIKRILDTEN